MIWQMHRNIRKKKTNQLSKIPISCYIYGSLNENELMKIGIV